MKDQGGAKVQSRLHKSEYYYGSTQLEHVGDADMEPESPLAKVLRDDPFGGDTVMGEPRRAPRYGGVQEEEVVVPVVEAGEKKRKREAEVLPSNTRLKVGGVPPLSPAQRKAYEKWVAMKRARPHVRRFMRTGGTADIRGGGIPEIAAVPHEVGMEVAVVVPAVVVPVAVVPVVVVPVAVVPEAMADPEVVVPVVVVTPPTPPPQAVEEVLKTEVGGEEGGSGEKGRKAGGVKVGVGKHPGASPGVPPVCGRGKGKGKRVVKSGRVEKPVTISGGRRSVTKEYPARGGGRQLDALKGFVQLASAAVVAVVAGVLAGVANSVTGVCLSAFRYIGDIGPILTFENRYSHRECPDIGRWVARTGERACP